MTNNYPIPSPAGQPILIHAIQHIRRMHMDCRTWTLQQGDEKAVNLLLNVYHGYLTGYERPAEPEFDRINHGPFEHPVSESVNGVPLSTVQVQTAELILTNAIRHIRRTHMTINSFKTLTLSDEKAIEILIDARFWAARKGF